MPVKPKSLLATPVFSLAIILFSSHLTLAQKVSSDERWAAILLLQPSPIEYLIGTAGDLKTSFQPDGTLIAMEHIYCGSIIRRELKLTDDQVQQIKSILTRHENDLKTILHGRGKKTISDAPNDESEIDLEVQMEKHFRQANTIADEILAIYNTGQRRRLREVQLRLLVSQVGFNQVLAQRLIRGELGLSPVPSAKIMSKKVSNRIRQQEIELIESALDTWLEDLTEQQRIVFDKAWKHSIVRPGGLALLALQLHMTDVEFEERSLADAFDEFPECRFRRLPIDVPANERSASQGRYQELQKLELLIYFVRTVFGKSDLEIVDFQTKEILAIHKEWSDERLDVNHEVGEKHHVPFQMMPVYGEPGDDVPIGERKVFEWDKRPELADEINRELDRRAGGITRRIEEDVLLPHQKEACAEVAHDFRIRVTGPLMDILHGKLGVELELTDKQKQSLQRKSESVRKKIMAESCKVFEQALNELILEFPEPDQAKLRAALGKPLTECFVDLSGFAIVLENRIGSR